MVISFSSAQIGIF